MSKSDNNCVTVIDSICGSGKTTYIFKYIKEITHQKDGSQRIIPETFFIFVTPFLDEITRLKKDNNTFIEPESGEDDEGMGYASKTAHLATLLNKGICNIVMTHCLFLLCIDMITDYVQNSSMRYELIIDESPDIFNLFELKSGDVNSLERDIVFSPIDQDNDKHSIFKKGLGVDKVAACSLNPESSRFFESKYIDVFQACKEGNVYIINRNCYISVLPLQLIKVFSEVKFLTYMFKNQFNELYLKSYGFQIKYQYTEKVGEEYHLFDGFKPYSGEHLRDLISVLNPTKVEKSYKFVEFANENYVLSSNWHKTIKKKKGKKAKEFKPLVAGIKGYYDKSKATQKKFMWTTYIPQKDIYEDVPFCKKEGTFCSCTILATNKYATKNILAYMINLFPNSNINNFVDKLAGNVSFKHDIYSLSSLIQWVFRSAIRNNEPIQVYIPSKRMRDLFIDWLNGEFRA